MNNKGMTLLELIIYIILGAFLLIPVIFLMHRSSVTMARDTGKQTLRTEGRDVMNIFYDDFKNLGFKANVSITDPNTGAFVINVDDNAFYSDSSSFDHTDGDPYDQIKIRRGVLDDTGAYQGVDTITYYVDNTTRNLIRNIKGITSGSTNQTIVSNVDALQFQYADSTFQWKNNPQPTSGSLLRKDVRYIRVYLLLQDSKPLAVTKTQNFDLGQITLSFSDQNLRELHQVVVPVPNNGLYP